MTSDASSLQDNAYILHTRPYKNSSSLVDVFSKQHGRFSLIAKGAKRTGSTFQGVLQPFIPLFLAWGGRSELKTLYKAESNSSPLALQGELLYAGFYVNELIMYLLHKHEAHPELFEQYHNCLAQLTGNHDTETVLRYFELELLNELGYGLCLDTIAATGEAVQSGVDYHYNFEIGISPIVVDDNTALKISGDSLLALASRNLESDIHKMEAKQLLRSVLEYYLDGKPIKTRELFTQKKKYTLQH